MPCRIPRTVCLKPRRPYAPSSPVRTKAPRYSAPTRIAPGSARFSSICAASGAAGLRHDHRRGRFVGCLCISIPSLPCPSQNGTWTTEIANRPAFLILGRSNWVRVLLTHCFVFPVKGSFRSPESLRRNIRAFSVTSLVLQIPTFASTRSTNVGRVKPGRDMAS